MKNKIDFILAKDLDAVPEDYFLINGIYLSGQLEQEQEYDICATSENLILEEEGIFDATFNKKDGYILYLWKVKTASDIEINRGLLCDVEDLAACQHARSAFNNKDNF